MRLWLTCISIAAVLCLGRYVRAEEEESVSSPATETTAETEQEPVSPDAASAPPQVVPAKEQGLRTRLAGRWLSEIVLSERARMRHLGGGRYGVRADKVFPFLNTIDLRAYEVGLKGLSIHFRGWAGLDLADIYFDERFVADLTTLYVQFRDFGVDAKIGRQMVFEGAARGLKIDGANVSYETPLHLGAQVFGGLAVSPKRGPDWWRGEEARGFSDFGSGFSNWEREGEFGDWAVGGRVFYRQAGLVNTGFSFLHARRDSEIDQQLFGADLVLTPVSWMAVSGNVLLAIPDAILKESNVSLEFFPMERVSLSIDYRHADPTLYLSRMSIFSVFSNEKYDSVGGDIRVRAWKWVSVNAGYHQHIYRFIESNLEEGAEVADHSAASDLGYEVVGGVRLGRMDLFGIVRFDFRRFKQDQNGMNQIYLGAAIPILETGLIASVNAHVDVYDNSINGETMGLLGDLGLIWRKDAWEVGGAFTAGVTPHARNEFRGLLKASYTLDMSFVERRQP